MSKTIKQKGNFGSRKETITQRGRTVRPSAKKVENENSLVQQNFRTEDIKFVKNPFRSKVSNHSILTTRVNPNVEHDKNEKYLKNVLGRPYFSPKHNSYEADLAFFDTYDKRKQLIYLFVININTRKLFVEQVDKKTENDLQNAFRRMIHRGLVIDNIRFDSESGLISQSSKNFFKAMNIDIYANSSPYTNKSRIVDRVIRTIRDMFFNVYGKKTYITPYQHHVYMQGLCDIYNRTYHRAIKTAPNDVTHVDEEKYIQQKQEELNKVLRKQKQKHLLSLKKGDKLRVYLDPSKTKERFKKQRLKYYHSGTFVKYNNGNVVCDINNNEYEVPIYHVILDKK